MRLVAVLGFVACAFGASQSRDTLRPTTGPTTRPTATAPAERRLTADSSLASTLASTYGTSGTSACGYDTSSCTCVAISLISLSLTGTIPSALGDCTMLRFLCVDRPPMYTSACLTDRGRTARRQMNQNSLTGSIPSTFSQLTDMTYL